MSEGKAQATFEPAPELEGVHYLGALHGADWFARSYFVERADGNLLVSPILFRPDLADWIEERGGLALIFVTHRDEIDPRVLSEVGREGPGTPPPRIPACEYKERFACQIAAHEGDAGVLTECEVDLVWREDFSPAPDLRFSHTPWHTPGSASLLLEYGERRIVFCGDTLGLDEMGRISTEIEEREIPHVPAILKAWSKLLQHEFDALVPLHTLVPSPVPFIATGGRDALREALSTVEQWWKAHQDTEELT